MSGTQNVVGATNDSAWDGLSSDATEIALLKKIALGLALAAGENHIGQVGGHIAVASANFTRPADTNAYAVGDLIANSTTAGSVVPLSLAVSRASDKTGMVRRLRLKTNDTAWANATVRVHLFKNTPTLSVGDNAVFSGGTTESEYLGYADITLDRHFSDAEKGTGIPATGSEWNFEPSAGTQTIFALLEARSAITPGSAKVWTLAAETHQN
jgi:hypothetical protein